MSEVPQNNASAALDGELTPVLSVRFALSWRHAALTGAFAALFLVLCYLPLGPGVTWRQARIGAWIAEHTALPAQDPLLPLAVNVPRVHTGWLSSLAIWQLVRLGPDAAAGAAAALSLISLLLIAVAVRRSGAASLFAIAVAAVYVVALSWGQLTGMRSQLFGGLCLASLLLMLAQQDADEAFPRWRWLAVPLCLMLWANLDGSFFVGVGLLAAMAVGATIDAVRETGFRAVVADGRVRRSWLLFELSAAATLINPLGLNLWVSAFDGVLWQAVGGARPLVLASWTGFCLAASAVAAMILLRKGKRRITSGGIIAVGLATVATAFNVNFIYWLAPLAAFFAAPYIADLSIGQRREAPTCDVPLTPQRFIFTLIAGLIVWAAFAVSPLSTVVLGNKPRPAEKVFGQSMPVAAAGHAAPGLLFAPGEWSDAVYHAAPAGVRLFADSGATSLPRLVQRDYLRITRAEDGWLRTLDRYAVASVLVDKTRQRRLLEEMREADAWSVKYEDDAAALFVRQATQSNPAATGPEARRTKGKGAQS